MKKLLLTLGIILLSSNISYGDVNKNIDISKHDFMVDDDLNVVVLYKNISPVMLEYLKKTMDENTKACFEYIPEYLNKNGKNDVWIRYNEKDISRHIEIFTKGRLIICHGDRVIFVEEVLKLKD